MIGVISDVREHSLEASSDPEMYLPPWQGTPEGAELVLRTKLAPAALAPTVMKTLRALNPGQPVNGTPSASAYSGPGCFAAAILRAAGHLLCRAGSGAGCARDLRNCLVFRDPTKAGDRHPHGARCEYVEVQKHVIARAMQLVIAGAIIGAVASFAVGKWIASLLFATRPTDPATFLSVFALLVVVALAAGYVPARRASRIERDGRIAQRIGVSAKCYW